MGWQLTSMMLLRHRLREFFTEPCPCCKKKYFSVFTQENILTRWKVFCSDQGLIEEKLASYEVSVKKTPIFLLNKADPIDFVDQIIIIKFTTVSGEVYTTHL